MRTTSWRSHGSSCSKTRSPRDTTRHGPSASPNGERWHDKQGLDWVNPYNRQLWEYDIRVAEDAARLGFGEVQFDYIRFPEPYKSLPEQIYPGADAESKAQILADFLRTARERVDKLGVRTTADIFGMVASMSGPLEVGQQWDALAPTADVLLPWYTPRTIRTARSGWRYPTPNHTRSCMQPSLTPTDVTSRSASRVSACAPGFRPSRSAHHTTDRRSCAPRCRRSTTPAIRDGYYGTRHRSTGG